jgi:hypothetical protein
MTGRSLNDSLSFSYSYSLERAVARIRDTADRIERIGQPTATRGETRPNHLRAYGEVVSEIQGLLGNLNLSSLLDAAKNADHLWEV